jgi:hypothetical protein
MQLKQTEPRESVLVGRKWGAFRVVASLAFSVAACSGGGTTAGGSLLDAQHDASLLPSGGSAAGAAAGSGGTAGSGGVGSGGTPTASGGATGGAPAGSGGSQGGGPPGGTGGTSTVEACDSAAPAASTCLQEGSRCDTTDSGTCCRCVSFEAPSCGLQWECAIPGNNASECPSAAPSVGADCTPVNLTCQYCSPTGPTHLRCNRLQVGSDEGTWGLVPGLSCEG